MIKETKIGDNVILVEQTTYYVYKNKERKERGKHSMSTSDLRKAEEFAIKLWQNE